MDIEYHLIRSDRRSIGIEVDREGKVTVRAPYSCEKKRIDRLLLEKENWIRQKVKLQKENAMKRQEKREMPEAEKKYYRNLAREVLGARTGYYARMEIRIATMDPSFPRTAGSFRKRIVRRSRTNQPLCG